MHMVIPTHVARSTHRSAAKPEAAALPKRMKRGQEYRTPNGVRGLYVGTTWEGEHWFAFRGVGFLTLCQEFDAKYGKPAQQRAWLRAKRAKDRAAVA